MSRIFLIEQDHALREWCRLHLSSAGFAVAAFDDGRRALEALRVEPPDLMIISTNLTGMGAFAAAATIRSNPRSAMVPILFLVPDKDAVALTQARAVDPAGVLTKPFSHELLVETATARVGKSPGTSPVITQDRRPGAAAAGTSRSAASGPLLETKQASVLVISVRNFVSLARSLNAAALDRFLGEFASHARQAVFDAGGWIVRADAMSVVALFEDVPDHASPHAARALEAALGTVLAARAAKRWGESNLPNRVSVDVSVGCGVHTGEVIVARLTVGGHLAPSIAGQTADLAQRLEGRAKGLRWSIACSEYALLQAGARFEVGYRSSLTDSDHGTTIPIVEIRGYLPGSARPGELARMAIVREAMLANSLLASLAGDVDQETAERTLMVRPARPAADNSPLLPGRRIERRLRQSSSIEAYVALHLETGRREVVKVIRPAAETAAFVEAYQADYGRIQEIQQRNIATIHEIGRTGELAFVAVEYLSGGSLAEAMQRQLAVGAALNSLAQACLAIDGLHQAGIVHGNLAPEHFHFRGDGALVLADFNTSQRLHAVQPPTGETASAAEPPRQVAADTRADFKALGRILHALLTGDRMLVTANAAAIDAAELERASRLPLPLSPIQPCLDGLLGVAGQVPLEQAPDVLLALRRVREAFEWDPRASAPPGPGGRRGTV